MKALGTFFAIVLAMSPVVIANAQTAAQPTSTPNVVTESDLQKATAGLSKEIKRNTAELKAELARETKAQADAQRAADKAAANKRDADQKAELARETKAQADAVKTRNTIIGIALALFAVMLIVGALIRMKRATMAKQTVAVNAAPTKTPTPEDLYGQYPSPAQVKKSLLENNLKEGRFTIDLPEDGLVFEYRAVVSLEGTTVTARFAGNGDEVTALRQLRKRAKELYADGAGPLKPITLKPIGIRRVS
jgi:hypothetical protein